MNKTFASSINEARSIFGKALPSNFSIAVFSLLIFLTWSAPAFSQQARVELPLAQTNATENTPVSARMTRSLPSDSVAADIPDKIAEPRTSAPSADGDTDASFNAGVSEGFGFVEDTITQPDGKIIVGGSFNGVNGAPRNFLARLNVDGSTDATFNPGGTGPSGAVLALARQPDGKILIGGNGGFYNGAFRGLVTRLNADGTPDAGFVEGFNANGTVETIAVQPDGKILIGGIFTTYRGAPSNYIARLNADGTLDTTFNIGTGFNIFVFTIVLQSDGKILVGGAFAQYNGTAVGRIARLNSNGSLDNTFNPGGAGANSQVEAIVLQPDGKIVAGGFFSTFNGTATPSGLVRLNPDGTIENAFAFPGVSATVSAVELLPNGTILAGGTFTNSFSGTTTTSRGISVFTGSQNTGAFKPGSANGDIGSIKAQPDGKVLVGGAFTQYNGEERRRIVRLNSDGTTDNGFTASINTAGIVYRVAPQADGKIVIGGDFESVNGAERRRVARLNADGSLDANFNVGSGPDGTVFALAVQPDGKIIVGGSFSAYNGVSRNRVARLNADGSLDTSFISARSASIIFDIKLQPDGKIVLGGSFPSNGGGFSAGVVRLNADGGLDGSFGGFPPLPPATVRTLALQSDGSILAGGNFAFTNFSGSTSYSTAGIYKITPNGLLDSSFSFSSTGFTSVEAISVLPDGRILIGGSLTANNQFTGALRLFPNGAVDQSFNAAATANGTIRALLVQPNGKILIGGFFSGRIARLNADGSRDTSFNASADNFVDDIAIQPDGKILVGGGFTIFNNAPRRGIARLQGSGTLAVRRTLFDYDGDGKADISVWRPSNGVWYLLGSNSPYTGVQFGISTDKTAPADYDGDGKTDIAVYRDGNWFIQRSTNGFLSINFGSPGDVPAPADFDGDGKSELAVFRPSNGVWYVLNLTNNAFSAVQFGQTSDVPVAGDYDGDGKSDYAVYRPSNGVWYLLRSRDGFIGIQFGISTDKPVVGDYDGDGRADQAVYRAEGGTWFLNRSTQGFASINFGLSTDIPAPADFDGDGRTDIAVFRPGNGVWYQQKSRDGFGAIQFGALGDIPTPSSFVP